MKWGVSLPERRANIASKAGCIRCLRRLHQPWNEIYPKLRIQKQMALKLVRGSLPVLGSKGSLKVIKARNRAKLGIKSEAQLIAEQKQKAKSEFIRIRNSFRRNGAQLRKRYFKPSRKAALDAYYKNHEESKRISAAAAKRRYYRDKGKPDHKVKRAMYNAISRICRDYKTKKSRRTCYYFSATIHEVRVYLEKQFRRGMTWRNHGTEWEIDHRVPLAMFDLSDERHMVVANHFTNLQPLWKRHNREKSDRLERHEHLALL